MSTRRCRPPPAAFPGWAATTPLMRARVMFRFRDLLDRHAPQMAAIITAEHGKVLSDALGEVTRGMEVSEFACGVPDLLKGDYTEQVGRNVDSYSVRQPLGVCAGITPFNFPAMVPLWMIPVALATGNCFILKPSERRPLRLAAAGRPAGRGRAAGTACSTWCRATRRWSTPSCTTPASPRSASSARRRSPNTSNRTASAQGKRVQALGGAKNHAVIMPDADLDQTTDALMGAAYGSAGERCMAISVAVAVGGVGDRLIDHLAPRVRGLKVGPGTDAEAEMGPLVTGQHRDRVRGYIDAGVADGARLVVDGRDIRLQGYEDGFFVGGTLFDDVTPE